MPLAFVDTNGGKGWIDDDLSVFHLGQNGISEAIEAFIEEARANVESTEEILEQLVIELPHTCEVREITRVDGDRYDT